MSSDWAEGFRVVEAGHTRTHNYITLIGTSKQMSGKSQPISVRGKICGLVDCG